MTFNATFSLLDDDGLLVVASTAALKKHHGGKAFQQKFPEELLALVNLGAVFAWQTGGEGEHQVEIAVSATAQPVDEGAVTGTLEVQPDDLVLVMPYSSYTFGCEDGGTFTSRGRLAAEVPVSPGVYAVAVERVREAGSSYLFRVSLSPAARRSTGRVKALPGWQP